MENQSQTDQSLIENPSSLFMLSAESNHFYQIGKLKSHNKREACSPCKSQIKRLIPKKKPKKSPPVAIQTSTDRSRDCLQNSIEIVKETQRLKSLCKEQEKELRSLRNTINCMDDELGQKENLVEDLKDQIYSIENSQEEWIGRTLKFQYLGQQIKRIGMNQSEDIIDCFDDIEVPEVSVSIRKKFIPTEEADSIVEYVEPEIEAEYYGFSFDNEEEIINDYDDEIIDFDHISDFGPLFNNTVYSDESPWHESRFPTPIEIDAAIRIQRFYKKRLELNHESLERNYQRSLIRSIEEWERGMDHVETDISQMYFGREGVRDVMIPP